MKEVVELTVLDQKDLSEKNGGIIIPVIAIALAYGCWAASFCYELGRD